MTLESRFVRRFRKLARLLVIASLAMTFLVGGLRVAMILDTRGEVVTIAEAEPAQAALVLGAGLLPNKTPSAPLRDRIDTAINLYNLGKVKKLLMSGDNRFVEYNEPEAMRQYALSQGVPDQDIVLDYAGRRTYDSCYRANAIFGLDTVIIVTQNYHLPRALFLCNRLNVTATGVPADQTRYLRSRYSFWRVREVIASLAAFYDIYLHKPLPVLGEYEPIFPGSLRFPTPGINLAQY